MNMRYSRSRKWAVVVAAASCLCAAPEAYSEDAPSPAATVAPKLGGNVPLQTENTNLNTPKSSDETQQKVSSIMFVEEDILNLDQVISVFYKNESKQESAVAEPGATDDDLIAELLRTTESGEDAPILFPDFYLSTIIYRNPGDWSVWITSHNVEQALDGEAEDEGDGINLVDMNFLEGESEGEAGGAMAPEARSNQSVRINLSATRQADESAGVRVVAIDRESVKLAWKPKNSSIAFRQFQIRDEKNEAFKPIQHRKADGAIDYDETLGEIVITMRPNQTFAGNLMQLVEGRFNSGPADAMPSAELAAAVGADPANVAAPAAGGQSLEQRASEQLIDNLNQVNDFLPQREIPSAAQ